MSEKNVGINIESKVGKNSIDNITKAISVIFNEGRKNNHDQSTIVEALNVLRTFSQQNTNISGCNLHN